MLAIRMLSLYVRLRTRRWSASATCLIMTCPVCWRTKNRSKFPGGDTMKATQLLHNLGQSIWLDNITRDLLDSGTLKTYIDDLSVTGLTSNPTIFNHAIKNSSAYSAAIRTKFAQDRSAEEVFFELALEDL